MMHLKNISAGNPKTMAQIQLTKRSGVIWLYSEDRQNWYEEQKKFAADTLKIAYDQNGVIVNISKDVSTINPTGLSVVELRLGTVIDRCRLVSRTDFMISAGIRKNSPTGNIHPDGLTKTFVKARKASGVNFSNNPPTFHEIRSLAGRLYKNERGEEFAQKLLGHTSENTTKLYLDERDNKAYVML